MSTRNKAVTLRIGPVLRNVLIMAATYLLLSAMLFVGITPEQHDIQVGAPAPMDILATKDVNDTVTTDELRNAAAAAVEPSYKSVDFSVVGNVSADMEAVFNQLFELRESDWPDAESITDEEFSVLNASLTVPITREE